MCSGNYKLQFKGQNVPADLVEDIINLKAREKIDNQFNKIVNDEKASCGKEKEKEKA